MDKPWKVIFAFVGVFIAGAVFGAFFTLRVDREHSAPRGGFAGRPELPRRGPGMQMGAAMFRHYARHLKLTEEQRDAIRPIVTRAEEELQRLRRENFQDTARVMDQLHNEVSAVLTAEQRVELETLRKNLRERLRRAQEDRDRRGEPRRGGARRDPVAPSSAGDDAGGDERKGN